MKPIAGVEGIVADLSNEADVERAFDQAGEVFGVVHLVGGFAAGNDAAVWSQMIALNVMTAATVTRIAASHLVDGGRIVAISSQATLRKPPGLAAYVATKSALNALIEVLAAELKDRRITVNALLPDTLGASGKDVVPTSRVADAIAWLLSDEAANVTGALIPLSP